MTEDHTEGRQVARRNETAFSSVEGFEVAQRMATALAKSDLVPEHYKGSVPNCLLALEMSQRLQMNPLMVMQNMYLVHGKPSWSSQFLVACVNGSGRFSPLRYEMAGSEGGNDRGCRAWAIDSSGERLDGPWVSIEMAKKEGWIGRKGSKWETMAELMLRYRAATLFARLYAPELTMGMQAVEEIEDVQTASKAPSSVLSPGRHDIRKKPEPATPKEEPEEAVDVETEKEAFAELAKLASANPMAMQAAIDAAREANPSFSDVESWDDVDAGNIMQCRVLLAEARRIAGD